MSYLKTDIVMPEIIYITNTYYIFESKMNNL